MSEFKIDLDLVTQLQLETYFKTYREVGGKELGLGLVESGGAMVRAAVKMGWLDMDVDNASPREVRKIADLLDKYIASVMKYDKKN